MMMMMMMFWTTATLHTTLVHACAWREKMKLSPTAGV